MLSPNTFLHLIIPIIQIKVWVKHIVTELSEAPVFTNIPVMSIKFYLLQFKYTVMVMEKLEPCARIHNFYNNHYSAHVFLITCLHAWFLLITCIPPCACKANQSARERSLPSGSALTAQRHVSTPSTERISPFFLSTHHWVTEVIDDDNMYSHAPAFCCLNCAHERESQIVSAPAAAALSA